MNHFLWFDSKFIAGESMSYSQMKDQDQTDTNMISFKMPKLDVARKALKGRNITAQGTALGNTPRKI